MQFRLNPLDVFCLTFTVGCATTKVAFQGSPLQPAADAEAKVHLDENRNAIIELELKHVAPVEKLWPPRALYVVWAESSEGRVIHLGQLIVNEDREGHFNGTTAFGKFRLVITAEDEAMPEHPSQPWMLATDYFTPKASWLD